MIEKNENERSRGLSHNDPHHLLVEGMTVEARSVSPVGREPLRPQPHPNCLNAHHDLLARFGAPANGRGPLSATIGLTERPCIRWLTRIVDCRAVPAVVVGVRANIGVNKWSAARSHD